VQHNAYHKVDVLEQKVTVHKWALNFVGQVAPCMVHGWIVLYGEIGFYLYCILWNIDGALYILIASWN
jgi:hypothetical protein